MKALRLAILGGAAVIAAAACSEAPQLGRVTALLTDSAGPIGSATVWVSKVYLVGSDSGDTGRVVLSTTPTAYDLLSLQNGVTALLGTGLVPAGHYAQLRLVVDSAEVGLLPGLTFGDSTTMHSLKVPSGMQSGIKVDFSPPLHVTPDTTTITVDFNVAKNFKLTGPRDAPNGVLFTPVLQATVSH